MSQLFTTIQLAELLNISPKSLTNSRSSGVGIVIPFLKIGGSVRYRKSDVEEFIERQTYTSTGGIKAVKC